MGPVHHPTKTQQAIEFSHRGDFAITSDKTAQSRSKKGKQRNKERKDKTRFEKNFPSPGTERTTQRLRTNVQHWNFKKSIKIWKKLIKLEALFIFKSISDFMQNIQSLPEI